MSYYGHGGSSYGSSRSKSTHFLLLSFVHSICSGSYGDHRGSSNGHGRDRPGGNSLLDDLDSFDVAPIRPGPPIVKNFYAESPMVASRPPVNRPPFSS